MKDSKFTKLLFRLDLEYNISLASRYNYVIFFTANEFNGGDLQEINRIYSPKVYEESRQMLKTYIDMYQDKIILFRMIKDGTEMDQSIVIHLPNKETLPQIKNKFCNIITVY